jgi:polyphosphate kinase
VLTGYARHGQYRRILVSPQGVRNGIVERIEAEITLAREGRPCGIRMKLNSLVDEQVIDALYHASIAGVPIRIVVRGICALRAGVDGLSENIEVRSVLGRFLEHSRIFHFAGAGEYWIGSADMMHRNLDRRIETLVWVTDTKLAGQLDRVLNSALHPSTRCWILNAKGDWEASPRGGEQVRDHQIEMLREHGAQV